MFKVNDYVSYEYCYERRSGRIIGINKSGILIRRYHEDVFIGFHTYSYLRIVKLGEYRKIKVKSWFWGEYEKEVYVKEN